MSWKPPDATLTERFIRHLGEGVGGELPAGSFRIAYWADLVDRETTDPAHDEYTEPHGRFRPLANRELLVARARGFLRSFGVDALGALIGGFVERPDSDEEEALSFLTGKVLDAASRPLYAALLREFHQYFRGGSREPVKARLEEELAAVPAGGGACLIAHSMGSLIAADILASCDHRVDLLLTIGSPLGISVLRRQLGLEEEEARERLQRNIGRWVNLYDQLDKIALDHDLDDDFPDLRIEDEIVDNEFVNKEGERNHQKSYGYLRSPKLGRLVAEFLG